MSSERGFTIIEILITIFIIGTVVTGVFGLFVLNLRTNQEAERRVVAVALVNEQAEKIRNLSYAQIGTQGGIPAGSILPTETITRNGVSYTVQTDIRYIDDPFDGTITSNPPDLLNTDYKQARIEVTWNSPSSPKPLVMILQISPPGVEGGTTAGTLLFQAINAAAQGVEGATIHLTNSAVAPAVNITTQTDSAGRVVLPGLPPANGSYKLTVSNENMNSEQTYDTTASFIPNADHTHLSMIAGQLTQKTFAIDSVSSLSVKTQLSATQPQGGIAYALQGTKVIGSNNQGQPVYVVAVSNTTNSTGTDSVSQLIWDSYSFSINGVATGFDIKETNYILPLSINPGSTIDLIATLVPHQPVSMHVSVVSPTGAPVDNATVRLFNAASYNQTLGTGQYGQVYFPANPANPPEVLPGDGSYTVEVSAPGYQPASEVVAVQGTTRLTVELTPTP